MEWLEELAVELAGRVRDGKVRTKQELHMQKQHAARAIDAPRLPQDPELIPFLPADIASTHGHLFRKKPMRSQSGVAIIAVMSGPAACPHGKCIYCPGGPDVDAPQSYTGFEPSTMRAKRYGYDPYRITRTRLAGLERNGHTTDKLEIIIQGGTFPARPRADQDWHVASIYAACNDGPGDGESPFNPDDWNAMPEAERLALLREVQLTNESAAHRVIGLTVETKPDWCLAPHVDAMLEQGATRIELGIQTLSEEITQLTHRGHTMQDSRDAMRIGRDAGYKICVHMMPGLPRPSEVVDGTQHYAFDREADIEDMRQLFEDPDFRPDMIKIYPTLIVQEGETTLKKWWRDGRFTAMDTEAASDVVAESLRFVPEYCRIQRIDRDIPTTHVLAGVMNSNLRQIAEAEAGKRNIDLRDIRSREVGTRMRQGRDVDPERLELVRRDYEASGGQEAFLSLEDVEADALAGFVRVRRVGTGHRSELPAGSAVIRELKVYGQAQGLGEHDPGAWQHRGLGRQLVEAAAEIAQEWGAPKLAVLAGPGVKEYYRRLEYRDLGPYLVRSIP